MTYRTEYEQIIHSANELDTREEEIKAKYPKGSPDRKINMGTILWLENVLTDKMGKLYRRLVDRYQALMNKPVEPMPIKNLIRLVEILEVTSQED